MLSLDPQSSHLRFNVETDVLRFGSHGGEGHHGHEDGSQTGGNVLYALTAGGVRTVGRWAG